MSLTTQRTPSEIDALVEDDLDLARGEAEKMYWRIRRTISRDDLYSAALLGLWDAAKRYDPLRGWRFPTYATHRIRGALLDHVRDENETRRANERPALLLDRLLHYEGRRRRHEYGDGRRAHTLGQTIAAPGLGPAEACEQADRVRAILALLPAAHRRVAELRCAGGLTLREVGERIGRTEGLACDVMRQVRLRLRRLLLTTTEPLED
jgi:RNA polymerase sigma factor (sigma-70 family)